MCVLWRVRSRHTCGLRRVVSQYAAATTTKGRVWLAVRLAGLTGAVSSGCIITHHLSVRRAECQARRRNSHMDDDDLGVADMSEQQQLTENPVATFDWIKFRTLLYPDVLLLLGAVASALAVALMNIKIPMLLGDVVNAVSKMLTEEGRADFFTEVKMPALRLIYAYALQGLLTFSYVALLSCVGERVACRLRCDLFGAIVRQDIAFFDAQKTGELVNRLTVDIQDFKSNFKLCVSQGLRSFAQIVGCVISLYTVSPQMTCCLVVSLPVIVAAGSVVGSFLRQLSNAAADQISKATWVANEAIGNVRTVRAFAMEKKEIEMYRHEVEHAARLSEHLGIGIGVFQGMTNIALNGIVLGVVCLGGYLISVRNLNAGDLMSFLVATQTIQRSLAQVSLLYGHFVKGISAGARVFEYVNMSPTMELEGGETISLDKLRGHLEFRNVTFVYPTRSEQVVLQNFNLVIPAGRIVALCGPSGGGKSTTAALVERFYDVNEGGVFLDGYDLRHLDASWLRGKVIGFIGQEPTLFATSVMENIRYGKPDATDEEVKEAAILANANEFIEAFPNGYQTVLGERGVTVSGGQKQRIAIARALIKNPAILILDEATSALDLESERLVQDAIERIVKGRTVLVIAHRLSTIQNADVIVVLAGGVVVESGSHNTLKKLKGYYWDMIDQQQKEEMIHEHRPSA